MGAGSLRQTAPSCPLSPGPALSLACGLVPSPGRHTAMCRRRISRKGFQRREETPQQACCASGWRREARRGAVPMLPGRRMAAATPVHGCASRTAARHSSPPCWACAWMHHGSIDAQLLLGAACPTHEPALLPSHAQHRRQLRPAVRRQPPHSGLVQREMGPDGFLPCRLSRMRPWPCSLESLLAFRGDAGLLAPGRLAGVRMVFGRGAAPPAAAQSLR